MLKKLSRKVWIDVSFFFNRLIWYFLSIVIFSRLLYVISDWYDIRHIENPIEFFITSEYSFSLYGVILWFLWMLLYSLKANKLKGDKYIDVSVLSFLFTVIVWYVWAFFWWQVYGWETNFWIEIIYNNQFTIVPYEVAIFPLALIYAIWSFILFSVFYSLFLFVNIRWLVGYMWFISFNAMILVWESFTWKYDILKTTYLFVNLNQVIAIVFILLSVYKLIVLLRNQPSKTEVISA